jgi:hypothetical protein
LEYLGAERVSLDEIPSGSCSVIVSSHSLEHLTETSLHSVVARLRESLRPGGHLLVEVPHGGFSYTLVPVKPGIAPSAPAAASRDEVGQIPLAGPAVRIPSTFEFLIYHDTPELSDSSPQRWQVYAV